MPTALDHLDQLVITTLRSVGQRYTSGRRLIVHTLAKLDAPATIRQILAYCPELAQSSVYRNLDVLIALGVARRVPVPLGDHGLFELADDNLLCCYRQCAHCHTTVAIDPPALPPELLDPPIVSAVITLIVATCPTCEQAAAA